MHCPPSIAHKLQLTRCRMARVGLTVTRFGGGHIAPSIVVAIQPAVIVCCWDKSHEVTLNGQCHTLQCREGFVQMDLCNYATLNGGNALVR